MGYSTGILDKRIVILNRKKAETSDFGLDGEGIQWEETTCVWANVTWSKGVRALSAGAIDAYAVKMVRIRWTSDVTMRSRVRYEDQVFQILSDTFQSDKRANTIQFLMQQINEE